MITHRSVIGGGASMAGSCIKGSAFQAVVDDLQLLTRTGELGEGETGKHLRAADLEILSAGVLPGSWYPIDSYRRMLALLVAKQGSLDREAYLRRRGVAAAERILKMGLYSHLEASLRAAERNPARWVEQVGRVMTTLSPAMFNFSTWEFVAGAESEAAAGRLFTLKVAEARDLPDETVTLLQGFIESLFAPFTDEPIAVRGSRPTLDTVVFKGSSQGVPRRHFR
jgi:hypothetical protein